MSSFGRDIGIYMVIKVIKVSPTPPCDSPPKIWDDTIGSVQATISEIDNSSIQLALQISTNSPTLVPIKFNLLRRGLPVSQNVPLTHHPSFPQSQPPPLLSCPCIRPPLSPPSPPSPSHPPQCKLLHKQLLSSLCHLVSQFKPSPIPTQLH